MEPSYAVDASLLPDDLLLQPRGASSAYHIGDAVAMADMKSPLGFVLALGAPGALEGRGVVFLYALNESLAWEEKGVLEPSGGYPGMGFGSSIAIGDQSDMIA
eukprot:scaffold1440_cov296-Pinguiococcus_pyrenoidosus.AAC.1